MGKLISKYRLEHARKRKQGYTYRGKGIWSRELSQAEIDQMDKQRLSQKCIKLVTAVD